MNRTRKIFCSGSREGTTRAPLFAMRSRSFRVAFVAGVFATVAIGLGACSDSDPRYGTPEAIKGRKVPFPTAQTTDPGTDTDGGGTTTKTPAQLFGVLYNGATPDDALKSTCTPCHATGGNGVTLFIADSEANAYKVFQDHDYKDLTIPQPKGFFTKGAHTGPALTAAQQTAAKKWADAEKAGGGTTPTPEAGAPADAGDGG